MIGEYHHFSQNRRLLFDAQVKKWTTRLLCANKIKQCGVRPNASEAKNVRIRVDFPDRERKHKTNTRTNAKDLPGLRVKFHELQGTELHEIPITIRTFKTCLEMEER